MIMELINNQQSFKFIVITLVFEGLAGCVRERKSYQQNIKIDTLIHPKSMIKQCRIYARERDARMIEHVWKMEAKREPKSTKCNKKQAQQSMRKKNIRKFGGWGGRPLKTKIIFSRLVFVSFSLVVILSRIL